MQKLNAVSASEHIQALYRLLLIRTGRRTQAEHALHETLTESIRNTDGKRDKTDFAGFYRTALKITAPVSEPPETDLAGWPLALHHLPEPDRSAITLFYLEIFSPRVLSDILEIDIEELARIIGSARRSLETQQTKSITS
jgi:DNA-directed RNA polymerase specialized sigma24 family protein